MPELPDVAGFKQYFDATSLHQRIDDIDVTDDRILDQISPAKLINHLADCEFIHTRRHGKHLFAQTGKGKVLAMHFGMTGELSYQKKNHSPPDYARVVIHFATGYELAYTCRRMLGRVTVTDDIDTYIDEQELGPDALDDSFNTQQFIERMNEHRSMIKPTLMNQKILAGIGNVWADEILYQARIHPETRASQLRTDTLKHLHRVMRRVLRTGARHGGDIDKLPNRYLLRHRDESHCPECGGPIEKCTVSGRTTYFCPKCQKKS